MAVAAYQQPQAGGGQQAPRVIEVEKLKDNLFVLRGEGGGGNTAVFVMANGVAVVDTKNPGGVSRFSTRSRSSPQSR